jgi:hypothetical protein
MPDNTFATGSQSPDMSLPDLNQLTNWILQALPDVRPQDPNDHSYRGRVVAALQLIETARDEGARWLDNKSKPAQQKAAELDYNLAHSPYKSLIKPEDPRDLRTASGYLLVTYGIKNYKTPEALREALVTHDIVIKPNTEVIDVRTREVINLGETVSIGELDRFAEKIKAKKAAQRRIRYEREKGGQKSQ